MTALSPYLLQRIMNCPQSRADECFPAMIAAMAKFSITNPARITCFLTQVKWESGGLVYFAELASGTAYEGRSDLGNNYPGDGVRYKGSGPIQVTGRDNFTQAQQALDAAGVGIDIVSNPDLARTVQYGFWISSWWWQHNQGNAVAERQPLSYASLCCGRLVNRGNADSPYPAQDEQARIDAFAHVSSFGDLSLPFTVPPVQPTAPPAPPKDADVTTLPEIKALLLPLQNQLSHLMTFVDGNPPQRNGQANRMVDSLARVYPSGLWAFTVNDTGGIGVFGQYWLGMHSPAEAADFTMTFQRAGVAIPNLGVLTLEKVTRWFGPQK